MSFGLSPSDIVAGIKLAVKIYEYGFAEDNRADVRYRNFRNEILNFRILLDRLDEAIEGAQQRYLRRGPALGQRPYEPRSKEFDDERKTIIGNFVLTLEECEALLEKNKHIWQRSSNVIENIRFNLAQQEVRVDHLRHRLSFHSQKIRLVLDRLSLNLLTDLDAKVDDILAISEQNLQVSNDIRLELKKFRASWLGYVSGNGVPAASSTEGSHPVGDSVAEKFYDNVRVNAPSGLRNGIPLSQGFDALLLHFEQSCEPGADQTPERYLLFLKSRWLLDRLKEGTEYKKARPGFYFKRAINQIEQAISERIGQPGELISYDENTLLSLPESCFHVWPLEASCPDVEYTQPHPLMVRGDEERLACVELAPNGMADTDTVTVFQSSDEHFRVVHESNPASTQGRTVITPYKVHVREDNLIPRYAFPTLTNPCLELAIFSRNEEELFKFRSIGDLHSLQTALMGYEVSHDQGETPVRCQLKLKNSTTVMDCSGRVQLWQDPIKVVSSLTPNGLNHSSSVRTQSSFSQGSHSRHDSIASSFSPTSTIVATAEGWEADTIKLPSIIVYTQFTDSKSRTRFAAIFVELHAGMEIDPKLCKCSKDFKSCPNLVIRNFNKALFPAHILHSETDADGNPNPNTFDIFPLRLPRRENFSEVADTKQAEQILFNFKTLVEKERFRDELNLRFQVREMQIRKQRQFEQRLFYEKDKPRNSLSPTLSQQMSTFGGSVRSLPSQSNNRMSRTSASVSIPRHYSTGSPVDVMAAQLGSFEFERVDSMGTEKHFSRASRTNSTATVRPPASLPRSSGSGLQTEETAPKKKKEAKKSFWTSL